MNIHLKKINDKFFIEYNENKLPIAGLKKDNVFGKWQQNTKLINFATENELKKVLDFIDYDTDFKNKLIKGFDVSDCVEVKKNTFTEKRINGNSWIEYKAYFKEPIEAGAIQDPNDKLLNDFANYCLINGITFKHSNQISEVITKYLKSKLLLC